MNLHEFFNIVNSSNIDFSRVEIFEQIYNASLPVLAKHILSIADEPIFVENYRILSYKEIQYAEEELQVPFAAERIIPFIDCMDNDFIVYDISNSAWTNYDIIDKIQFGKITELEKLLM